MADRLRNPPRPKEWLMLARLELGGTVSAAMVIENDLPAAWAADAIARRAVIAGLIVAFCKAAGRG